MYPKVKLKVNLMYLKIKLKENLTVPTAVTTKDHFAARFAFGVALGWALGVDFGFGFEAPAFSLSLPFRDGSRVLNMFACKLFCP